MTTPAINKNDQPQFTGTTQSWNAALGTWNPPVTTSLKTSSIEQESRPASHSNPKRADGFRNSGTWTHSYTSVNVNPIGNQVEVHINPQFPNDRSLMTGTACFNGSSFGLPGFPTAVGNLALWRALDDLKGQKWSPSQLFWERGKAIKTSTSVVKQVHKDIKAFKRDFPLDWRRLAENTGRSIAKVSPRFLELVYGIVPLLMTAYGACQDLADREKAAARPYRASVVGRSRSIEVISWDKPLSLTSLGGYRAQGKLEHRALVHLEYEMASPGLAVAAHLGISNPVAVAWNVLPWTYVADWFIPVGKYLSLLDAQLGFEFKTGSLTKWSKLDLRANGIQKFNSKDPGVVIPFGVVPYHERRFALERSVYSTAPSVPRPTFKSPVSALHLLEGIALLQGNFSRIQKLL